MQCGNIFPVQYFSWIAGTSESGGRVYRAYLTEIMSDTSMSDSSLTDVPATRVVYTPGQTVYTWRDGSPL